MVWMLVVPWPPPMNPGEMASAAQGNHPPRCAQAPAEAYARPAGSGNRLPVLDSEAPKLPIHTAIAVPQYGTQGSVGYLAALPIWRLSPLRTWIPPLWDQQRPQTRRQKHSPAQCPRTTFLCWSTDSPVPPIARSRRKPPTVAAQSSGLMPPPGRPSRPAPPRTPRRSSGGRRRWDADSRSHQPDPPDQAGHRCRPPARRWQPKSYGSGR